MRKGVFGCLVVLFGALLLMNGCAKEELVKKEEPIAASQAPVQQPAEKPAPTPPPPVKAEVIQSQPVKEAPVTAQAQTAREIATAQVPEKTLDKIFFDFDSYALSQAARDTLYGNAELLLKKYNGNVRLEGHCDERGSDEYNLALGEKRAKSALNYLVTLGVPADRLSAISYGKEKPADPGHDEAAWAKNRRVEFVVVK